MKKVLMYVAAPNSPRRVKVVSKGLVASLLWIRLWIVLAGLVALELAIRFARTDELQFPWIAPIVWVATGVVVFWGRIVLNTAIEQKQVIELTDNETVTAYSAALLRLAALPGDQDILCQRLYGLAETAQWETSEMHRLHGWLTVSPDGEGKNPTSEARASHTQGRERALNAIRELGI